MKIIEYIQWYKSHAHKHSQERLEDIVGDELLSRIPENIQVNYFVPYVKSPHESNFIIPLLDENWHINIFDDCVCDFSNYIGISKQESARITLLHELGHYVCFFKQCRGDMGTYTEMNRYIHEAIAWENINIMLPIAGVSDSGIKAFQSIALQSHLEEMDWQPAVPAPAPQTSKAKSPAAVGKVGAKAIAPVGEDISFEARNGIKQATFTNAFVIHG